MSASEKDDLATILKLSVDAFAPEARSFLFDVIGIQPTSASNGNTPSVAQLLSHLAKRDAAVLGKTQQGHLSDWPNVEAEAPQPGGAAQRVDLADAAIHHDELRADGTPKFKKQTYTGSVFGEGVLITDVIQGALNNCFFSSAVASVAKVNPELIRNMLKDNHDGTFTVTFKEPDFLTGALKDIQVTVDADFYSRPGFGPIYGRGPNASLPEQMKMWYPLIEKAYVTWKGSYTAGGSGGSPLNVFTALTGSSGKSIDVSGNADAVWDAITTAVDAKAAVTAGAFQADGPVNYTNTGVLPDHSYSVLGYEQLGGERFVILRNPWGYWETPADKTDGGIRKMRLEEFQKLFSLVLTSA